MRASIARTSTYLNLFRTKRVVSTKLVLLQRRAFPNIYKWIIWLIYEAPMCILVGIFLIKNNHHLIYLFGSLKATLLCREPKDFNFLSLIKLVTFRFIMKLYWPATSFHSWRRSIRSGSEQSNLDVDLYCFRSPLIIYVKNRIGGKERRCWSNQTWVYQQQYLSDQVIRLDYT